MKNYIHDIQTGLFEFFDSVKDLNGIKNQKFSLVGLTESIKKINDDLEPEAQNPSLKPLKEIITDISTTAENLLHTISQHKDDNSKIFPASLEFCERILNNSHKIRIEYLKSTGQQPESLSCQECSYGWIEEHKVLGHLLMHCLVCGAEFEEVNILTPRFDGLSIDSRTQAELPPSLPIQEKTKRKIIEEEVDQQQNINKKRKRINLKKTSNCLF